jgi:hypothetical protein
LLSEVHYEDVAHHFLRYQGTAHFEFIPQGHTVNQAYYVEIVKQLHEAVCRKRPEMRLSDWILRHDNAPANKALSVKQFLAQHSITEMEHPPCWPRMTSGFFQK